MSRVKPEGHPAFPAAAVLERSHGIPDVTSIATADGRNVAARFFRASDDIIGSVLIVPAMGVAQNFYRPFAAWLAEQGYLAATFDFRGIGLSRPGSLRGFKADVLDWARLDCAAMIDALDDRVPDAPLYWIGHSLGGQIVPFVPNRTRITKAVTVACGSGYWRETTAWLRWSSWWLWFVVGPISVRLFGYFPGRRLRKVGDLPRGVMEQWRRWCLDPEYAVGVEGEQARSLFADVRTPIVSLSFTDDEYMSARSTESIHGFYVNAPRTMKRIAPADTGGRRIGHFGFFRKHFEHTLWRSQLLPELR
jgi:predicted alpha/beta hydrolase